MKKKSETQPAAPVEPEKHVITLELPPVAHAMLTILAHHDGYPSPEAAVRGLLAGSIESLFEFLGKERQEEGSIREAFGVPDDEQES